MKQHTFLIGIIVIPLLIGLLIGIIIGRSMTPPIQVSQCTIIRSSETITEATTMPTTENPSTDAPETTTTEVTTSETAAETVETTKYVIDISDEEFNLLCKIVELEVGYDPTYYTHGDIDELQKLVASSVVSRIYDTRWSANTVDGIIRQPNQFTTLSRADSGYSIKDKDRVKKNIISVLTGEFTSDVNAFSSYEILDGESIDEAVARAVGIFNRCNACSLDLYCYAISADSRISLYGAV